MPNDDKLSFLEQLSNVLAGQSATAGAKALGEGIGYGIGGGALSDIPQVMREAIERHKEKSAAPKPKSEQDALELASALAAMSNPVSLAGHAVDFAGALPSMIEQKISGAELPTGEVMQSGLKRRPTKGTVPVDTTNKAKVGLQPETMPSITDKTSGMSFMKAPITRFSSGNDIASALKTRFPNMTDRQIIERTQQILMGEADDILALLKKP